MKLAVLTLVSTGQSNQIQLQNVVSDKCVIRISLIMEFIKEFPCQKCSKSFSSKDALRQHKFTHERISVKKIYVCGVCPINSKLKSSSMDRWGLFRHYRDNNHVGSEYKAPYTKKEDYKQVKELNSLAKELTEKAKAITE